jgi:hypothetical protein
VKKHAPATLRNRDAIADVLRRELPEAGTVLEVASGSGEHAVYFASLLPQLNWQPSDPSDEALASIASCRAEDGGDNLLAPLGLDAGDPSSWPIDQADAILCCNMVHISPWTVTEGLLQGAARLLPSGAPLLLYGPYFEEGVVPAESNLGFDQSLRMRDPEWGIRQREEVDALAESQGFECSARYEMPANNLTLVYRRN